MSAHDTLMRVLIIPFVLRKVIRRKGMAIKMVEIQGVEEEEVYNENKSQNLVPYFRSVWKA